MHPLQRQVLPAIDFQDHALRAVEPGLVVADRGGRDQRSVGADAGHFDHRHVERAKKALPRHRRDLAQMHVEIFHLATIDPLSRDRIGIIGQAKFDAVRFCQRTVQFGAGGCAGPDTAAKPLPDRMRRFDPLRQRHRHRLGIARTGEAAHADRHAVGDQACGCVRIHDPVCKTGVGDAISLHFILPLFGSAFEPGVPLIFG